MADERTRPTEDTEDARDKLIKQQAEALAHLRDDVARLARERDRLKRHNERLKRQLDAARRAGFRQAAPFAKDRPQGRGRPRGDTPVAGMGAAPDARFPPTST